MASGNQALIAAKVRGLARAARSAELDEVDASLGAGIGRDPAGAPTGFFLAEDDPRAVGKAVHWATARGIDAIEILAERHAGDLARRAALLELGGRPAVGVWAVTGATATPAEPEPIADPPAIPADHWALAGIMTEAGATAVDDHGTLVAEVAGLEVGRIVAGDDGPTIVVGVGQADRELAQFVHRDVDPGAGLRRVIAAVAEHRRVGGHHPLTRVGRERWLRSMLLDDPGLVGATELEPLVPLRPRAGLVQAEPSAAAGTDPTGRALVVVAMVGADLDLVPEAADYRHRHDPDAELVLAVPERDATLSSTLLNAVTDARLVALTPPWG